MNKLWTTILVVAVLLTAGCTNLMCNKPYIRVGLECCLDKDANNICDRDETTTTKATTTSEATTTTKATTTTRRPTTTAAVTTTAATTTTAAEATTTTKPTDTPAGYLSYESEKYGIKAEYPRGWTVLEDYMGSAVIFRSQKESASDDFLENVGIIIADLPTQYQHMTVDQVYDAEVEAAKNMLTDFRLIDSEKTTLSGMPAYAHTITYTQGTYKLKAYQVFIVKDGREYAVTYGATEKGYSKFLDEAEKIIDSVEVS